MGSGFVYTRSERDAEGAERGFKLFLKCVKRENHVVVFDSIFVRVRFYLRKKKGKNC